MDKRLKKGLIIGSTVLMVLIIGALVLNCVLENKLKSILDNVSSAIKIKYQDVHVNALTGSVKIIQPKILVYGKTTNTMVVEIESNELSINNLGYWNYFFNGKISIETISINQPKARYHHNELANLKSFQKSYTASFNEEIDIETIELINGDIEVFNHSDDSLILKAENINFEINSVGLSSTSLKQKIPFTYGNYQLTYNNLFYRMNDFEDLLMEEVDLNADFYKIQNLVVKTRYSHGDLSTQISAERDHFNLTVDSVLVRNHEFNIKNDSIVYFQGNQIDFYQPDFKLYRDKLVEDDLSYKPLYSKSLRNLKFDLQLDLVNLYNASVLYTEKVREDTKGGRLEFSNLNATINNLGSVSKDNDTSIRIEGVFMENTPLKVNWSFNVKDLNDEFIFKADIGNLSANHMNQFMEPNLNVKLNGEVKHTFFTINGNDHIAHIDLKLKYDDFKIDVLRQHGKEKNKFLSAVINLFVSSDSKDKTDDFRYGHAKDVERDKTKSVFNYLWLNIKAGLLNAMIGDGQKK